MTTATKRRPRNPFSRFLYASVPDTRLAVAEAPADQDVARQLLAAGMVGYRNRNGAIRDLGMPRRASDAGKVFAVGADREAGEP